MQLIKRAVLMLIAGAAISVAVPNEADAAYRQYYGGWNYHRSHGYHYRSYFYKPTPTYTSYRSHYCIHYPSRPRYVYFYNRYSGRYWGRFDTEGKEGAQYSLLKEEDRKAKLEDIPESAFPAPGAMPTVPEAEDNIAIEPPKDLPNLTPGS